MSYISRLSKDWEADLEKRLTAAQQKPNRKRVYICSPCRGKTPEEMRVNIKAARFYVYYSLKEIGVYARAPHIYLPVFMNDYIAEERELALRFGSEFLKLHDQLFVCGETISSGMREEIAAASQLNIPIKVFNEDVCAQTLGIVSQFGNNEDLVNYTRVDPILGNSPNRLFGWEVA